MNKKKVAFVAIIGILLIAGLISLIVKFFTKKDNENYEIAEVKQYNYFVLKQNNSYGVIDRSGNTIVNPEYDEVKIPNPEMGIFICYKDENTTVKNEKNENILEKYEQVEPIRLKNIASSLMYEKSILAYRKDQKYGLINFEGKEITKPIYDEIESLAYKEGELLVKEEGKYGVINMAGKEIIPNSYDNIHVDEYYTDENKYEYAGYIVGIKTEEGYRYGYLDSKKREVLPTEYNAMDRVTEIQDKDNSYLICAKNGQYGIYKNKDMIIPNEYQSIRYDTTNKIFIVEKSKKYGIANLEGKIIVPIEYSQIDVTGVYLYAQNEQETIVYNSDGTKADIDVKVSILNTNNEKYKIKINNDEKNTRYGVIDKDGNQLIEEKYNYIEYLYENYFIASYENGTLGVLDDQGNEKIELNKDSLQRVPDTELLQANITEGRKTQLYNKNMEKICEMEKGVIETKDNNVKVYNEAETKYFDKTGKELKNTEVYPNNKLILAKQNDKYGFVDREGNVVVDYKYEKAYEFNEFGYATIKSDGKWGAINEQGEEVAKPQYEIKGTSGELSFIGNYYRVTYGFGEFYYTDENNRIKC